MKFRWLIWVACVLAAVHGRVQAADSTPVRPGRDITLALGGESKLGGEIKLDFVWLASMKMWVGKYEVSNEQFQRFDAAHESSNFVDRVFDKPAMPVVFVSWEDANNYCGWLNRRHATNLPDGTVDRLPTAEEWSTFAQCGDGRIYPWGNEWPPPNAFNYRGEEGSGIIFNLFQNELFLKGHKDAYALTAPITEAGKSSWGLCGVGGNVWEWCLDWYQDIPYTKVLKGASWYNYETNLLAVANISDANPKWGNAMIGFRVVIGPKTQIKL